MVAKFAVVSPVEVVRQVEQASVRVPLFVMDPPPVMGAVVLIDVEAL